MIVLRPLRICVHPSLEAPVAVVLVALMIIHQVSSQVRIMILIAVLWTWECGHPHSAKKEKNQAFRHLVLSVRPHELVSLSMMIYLVIITKISLMMAIPTRAHRPMMRTKCTKQRLETLDWRKLSLPFRMTLIVW